MSTAIGYALLGIGAGAIYALLGQGIVLIYRGSGVLNLAQGAFAMIGAYLYLELHAPGSFGFGTFSTQSGWPVLPSFVVAVAATAALGLATDQLLLQADAPGVTARPVDRNGRRAARAAIGRAQDLG